MAEITGKLQSTGNIRASVSPGGQYIGSTVTVDPITTTGTHIADITVDGEVSALYAPEGAIGEPVTVTETETGDILIKGQGGSGGVSYTIPQATSNALGGVKADPKQSGDTQPVRIGTDGKLYVGDSVIIDDTLTEEGQAADAKAVGDAIDAMNQNFAKIPVIERDVSQLSESIIELDGRLSKDVDLLDASIVERDLFIDLSKTVSRSISNNTGTLISIDLGYRVSASDGTYHVCGIVEPVNPKDGYTLFGFRFQRINVDGSESNVFYNISSDNNVVIGSFDATGTSGFKVYASVKYTGDGVPFTEKFNVVLKTYKGDVVLNDNIKVKDSEAAKNAYNSMITFGTLNANKPNFDKTEKTLTFYQNTYIFNPNTGLRYKFDKNLVVPWDAEWVVSMNNVWFNPETKDIKMAIYTKAHPTGYDVLIGSINAKGDGWLVGGYTVDAGKGEEEHIEYELPSTFSSKIQEIQTNQKDKFVFAVQTDTHFYNENNNTGRNIGKMSQYIGFDFIANLGDIIRGYANETIDSSTMSRLYMTEVIQRYKEYSRCPVLLAVGNHDSNKLYVDAYGGSEFSKSELYGRIIKPTKNTVYGMNNPKGELYYYIDFDDVRVIVLNTQDATSAYTFVVSQKQIEWLETVLQTEKNVIVMTHTPLIKSLTPNYPTYASDVITKLKQFKDGGGKLIGCFYGHTHAQTSETADGILHVTFKDGGNNAEVVMVDTSAKTIETVGIGTPTNRSFTYI